MPPAAALGAGLGVSAIGGIMGASEAGNAAKNARRSAQAAFEMAQKDKPQFWSPSMQQQASLWNALQSQYNPQFLNKKAMGQAQQYTQNQFNQQAAQQLAGINERNAARGLWRSGIGAQQEQQFRNQSGMDLMGLLANQRLAWDQANQQAAAQAAQINAAQRGQALNYLQGNMGNQMDLYRTLMGFAQNQATGAGQAQQAAGQAFGSAFAGPANALTSYGTLGMMGGFGGATTPAANPWASNIALQNAQVIPNTPAQLTPRPYGGGWV